MICENCKHEIGPEDLKCPNCGADNPFAVKHAENMKNYGKAYGKTTQEVIAEAKKPEAWQKELRSWWFWSSPALS